MQFALGILLMAAGLFGELFHPIHEEPDHVDPSLTEQDVFTIMFWVGMAVLLLAFIEPGTELLAGAVLP